MSEWTFDQTMKASPAELAERASVRAMNAIALAETLRSRVAELEAEVRELKTLLIAHFEART